MFCKNKHKLLTLISFSLLYFVAAALGFHSRSVPLSFFLHTIFFNFSTSPPLKLISNLVCDEFSPIVLSPSLLILNCARGKKKCCCHVQPNRSHMSALTISPLPFCPFLCQALRSVIPQYAS